MAGIHGKGVVIRISTAETLLSGQALAGPHTLGSISRIFQVADSTKRDWLFDFENVLVEFDADNSGSGGAGDVDTAINHQSRLINYAGGAVHLGQHPDASGVYCRVKSMTLTTVASLIGDARNFTLSVSQDTEDTTVMGDAWKTSVDGLQGFEGSLDGLYVDDYWYSKAVATLSGVIPRKVARFIPNPAKATTYFQGTVIFPQWEITGGFDSVIEHSIPFQGRGPLDEIKDGNPYFNVHEN
jgi:predicted secreted protein